MGKELEVLGLADLGKIKSDDPYTLAYNEDHDNQIDIILRGDVEAMHCITHVHIPASGDYSPFYNPGGQAITQYLAQRTHIQDQSNTSMF